MIKKVYTVDFHMKSGAKITLELLELEIINNSENGIKTLNYTMANKKELMLYIRLDQVESIIRRSIRYRIGF